MMEEFPYDHDFNSHFASDLDYLQHDQQQQQQQQQQQHLHHHQHLQQQQPSQIKNQDQDQDQDQHINDMSASSNASDNGPQRPKRTRAKGEALDVLKRKFEVNPTPSLVERKKISDLVGMPEKNVRIWFQNRRAKLRKKQHGGNKDPNPSSQSHDNANDYDRTTTDNNSVTTTSTSSIFHDEDLTFFDRIPLNSNNNYYFFDICSITVGSWNRMKSGALQRKNFQSIKDLRNLSPIKINNIMSNATDLMVLISKKNSEINYFFSAMANNTKILFRIFFPLSSVTNCSLTLETDDDIINSNATSDNNNSSTTNNDDDNDGNSNEDNDNGSDEKRNTKDNFGELKLTVTRSPTFAVYFLNNSPDEDPNLNNQWSICDDFSEGRQVNDAFVGGSNIPHTLKGLQKSLRFMNSLILDYKSSNEILPSINTAIPAVALPQQNIAPPFLNTNSSATDSNPNTNLEDSLFFDHDLLSSSITNTNNGPNSNNERQGSKDDTLNLLDTTVNNNNNHNASNEDSHLAQEHLPNDADIVANSNDHLLSLPTDSELPNTPDFLKNTNELTDEHRWI
ncbi:Pho2p SKDI_04G1400 [Saccharomyces kudriavzevii IFO 1802]|uniref:PHO2-like protein n=2 Tax=Saccharomyces kudriavzevii (strain ATCC MYA-4449 / AS 2.2408 / CBS 8840 / NBRC 1802 / NCYC 2889) TaxID=226230 RepID=J6EIX7_SACK1|nr:uncharacterized protein SKDI_04G1400 [Saccharomyces kudriavzevii IFO 1802]EJT43262.1 PHO2-like protein [Saccharomyces kudriavzevii IFO 1802]CAI4057489.1 hypothetical protein SKDI_04G1400 [Saccharomyces kudriavzevii IFO 1802]